MKKADFEKFKNLVIEEGKAGNAVIMTMEGPMKANVDDLIDQPITGLLYDLNRLPEVILTIARKDIKWINDYAVMLVIARLKQMLEEKRKPSRGKK